jgi:hypothetical protein
VITGELKNTIDLDRNPFPAPAALVVLVAIVAGGCAGSIKRELSRGLIHLLSSVRNVRIG